MLQELVRKKIMNFYFILDYLNKHHPHLGPQICLFRRLICLCLTIQHEFILQAHTGFSCSLQRSRTDDAVPETCNWKEILKPSGDTQ